MAAADEDEKTDAIQESEAGSTDSRTLVTSALLLAMAVCSLEQTVVSTAMPSIIATLGGLEIYPWVFSAYLLASTVTTPLYGKLADRLGRKRVLLFGLLMFGLGSMLSGLAQSMPQLIAARVVQGLGAGAVGPIVVTMLGDLFTLRERARVQALFSVVWGVSSLAGPYLGGRLTDGLSWRWVFYVTVPFAVVSAWILVRHVREHVEAHDNKPIDWAGVVLLSLGSSLLLAAVLRGNGPSPALGVVLFLSGLGLLGLFAWNEHRAADPLLPVDLILTPNILASVIGSFMVGALLFGIDTYVPLYVQGVQGGTATMAGRNLTPLFVSWSISVVIAAWVVRPLGFRMTAVAGSSLLTLGFFALMAGSTRPEWASAIFFGSMVVIGLGMGPTSLSYTLDVQNSVEHNRRGTATSVVMFARMMGGALGVGLLGAALGVELSYRLGDLTSIDVAAALRPETHARLSPQVLAVVQESLGLSLRDTFLEMAVMSALALIVSFGLRGGHADAHATNGRIPGASGAQERIDLAAALEH
ncbi:MAG: MDR family MFS transporter [Isosphaeraceae bacterium]